MSGGLNLPKVCAPSRNVRRPFRDSCDTQGFLGYLFDFVHFMAASVTSSLNCSHISGSSVRNSACPRQVIIYSDK